MPHASPRTTQREPTSKARRHNFLLTLVALLALAQTACGPGDPLRVAVLMPFPEDSDGKSPAMEWVVESVNAAGGIGGRTFVLDYERYDPPMGLDLLVAAGERLAADEEHVAVIGPGTSEHLSLVADSFV